MAALHFDTLDYANQLIEAGVPREVANVQAQTMRQAFGFYIDDLVTRDYLGQRFAEQTAWIEQRFAEQTTWIEQRFAEQDVRLEQRFAEQDIRLEQRFAEQDIRIEQRFSEITAYIERRFAEQDAKFEARFTDIENRLTRLETRMNVLMALLVAGVIVPNLIALSRTLFGGG
ncbi:MAG: hypothetical protein V2I45_12115 [Halieaceae bacterium]|nr:hypothetical protein [Halieaceae bacterium]